jgi:RNA polymerase sigma-70 factor (ECF subfamily)
MRQFVSEHGATLGEIEVVYRGRLAELRRVATAITGSREAAFDAVQDAFALAVHRRAQFRAEGSLDAWLWRIVVNTARDAAARLSLSSLLPADGVLECKESLEERADSRVQDVQALVRELPDRQRLALFLHYYADLDYATIADVLDISVGTVGATLTQARENLHRLLTEVAS